MHPGNCSALPNFFISLIYYFSPDVSWDRIESASVHKVGRYISPLLPPQTLSPFPFLSLVRSIILPSSGHLPVQWPVMMSHADRARERAG